MNELRFSEKRVKTLEKRIAAAIAEVGCTYLESIKALDELSGVYTSILEDEAVYPKGLRERWRWWRALRKARWLARSVYAEVGFNQLTDNVGGDLDNGLDGG